jgi:hypothetical protein
MSPFAAADGDDGGDNNNNTHHRHNRRPYPNLLTDLQLHNDYFDSIVNMIPAKLYISGGAASGGGGSSSSNSSDNVKYRKGQHVESKEAKRAKDKAAKYDPNRVETTLETKKRVRMEQTEMEENESDDDVEDDIVMSDDDDGDDDDGSEVTEPTGNIGSNKKIGHNKNKNKNNTVSCTETSPVSVNLDEDISSSSYPSRIEALRAKLRAKVAALTGTTKTVGASIDGDSSGGGIDNNPALTSKRAARRAEKKRRMEAAKQRAGKTGSTSVVASADGSSTNKKRRLDTTTSIGKSSMMASSSSSSSAITTVANDLATIDYQSLAGLRPKLDGALDNKSLVGIGSIPSSSSSNKGKKKASLEKLLADAERKQARLRELKSSTNEADKEKARSIVWQDTFKVASVGGGDNLRKMNDPAVIKKAIKRKAKKKVASAKAWNSRIEKVHDAVSERQRIRSHNIDQRKLGGATAANLSSKRIVTDKDGAATEGGGGDGGKDSKGEKRRRLGPHSNRAGFEGKKNGFINGKQQQGDGGGSTSGGGGGKMGGR